MPELPAELPIAMLMRFASLHGRSPLAQSGTLHDLFEQEDIEVLARIDAIIPDRTRWLTVPRPSRAADHPSRVNIRITLWQLTEKGLEMAAAAHAWEHGTFPATLAS